MRAAFCFMPFRMAKAETTGLRRTVSITIRTLRGEIRKYRVIALASVIITIPLGLRARGHSLGFVLGRTVFLENACRRKFAELMADHILCHIDIVELLAVVNL